MLPCQALRDMPSRSFLLEGLVGLQLVGRLPGSAIDALQLGLLLIAPPVCTCRTTMQHIILWQLQSRGSDLSFADLHGPCSMQQAACSSLSIYAPRAPASDTQGWITHSKQRSLTLPENTPIRPDCNESSVSMVTSYPWQQSLVIQSSTCKTPKSTLPSLPSQRKPGQLRMGTSFSQLAAYDCR